MIELKHTCSF